MAVQRSWYEVNFVPEMNRAIKNLDTLGNKLVPRAAASTANKMARAVRKNTLSNSAKALKMPLNVLKFHQRGNGQRYPRVSLKLAGEKKPTATIVMRRSAVPAVRLIKKPALQDTRLKRVRRRGYIRAGQHVYQGGTFVASGITHHAKGVLKGRYQVMRRTGNSRYPLEVVKIEARTTITRHAIRETRQQLRQRAGALLAADLSRYAAYGLRKS